MKSKRLLSFILSLIFVFSAGELLMQTTVSGGTMTAYALSVAKVKNVRSSSVTSSSVTLSWDEVVIASGYRIYSRSSSGSYSLLQKSSSKSCKITGLKSGTTYRFAVQAYAKAGNAEIGGTRSDVLTVKTKSVSNQKPVIKLSSTKNAKTSQTLTATMTDDKGIKGYYWGKSPTYSNNKYTSVSGSCSLTKKFTVSSSGKYYLTVKDTSGAVTTSSVCYYKTTLKPNKGSCSVSYVISRSGDSVTLPTPVRSGYTYKGWATSSSASSGIKTHTASSDKTYYAVWSKKSSSSSSSQKWKSTDKYSFSNSNANFQTSLYEGYTVKSDDYTKLKKYIKNIYKNSSTYAQYVINSVEELKNETWGGSCYGMASTAILEKLGKTNLRKNYYGKAATLSAVARPNANSNVKSAINYYFLTQAIPATRASNYTYASYDSNWSTGLKTLVEKTRAGKISLFSFFWNGCGHAIVITGSGGKDASGNYILKTYDNNYPGTDTFVRISGNYNTCYVSQYGCYPSKIEYTWTMSGFDYVDIDGPDNDMGTSDKHYDDEIRTTITLPADANVKIVNKEGKTLTVKNGRATGTMKVYSSHDIVTATNENRNAKARMSLTVADSASFTFTSPVKKINATVLSKKFFNTVNVSNADKVVFSNGKVKVYGDNPDYTITIPVNNGLIDMIKIKGVATSDLAVDFDSGKLDLSGIDKDNAQAEIFFTNGTKKTVKLSSLTSLF